MPKDTTARVLSVGSEDFNTMFHFTNNTAERAMKAPFDDGGVDGMMTDVENARPLIEREAGLLDKQVLDEGLDSVLSGSQLHSQLRSI
jgi:hypothetical protein